MLAPFSIPIDPSEDDILCHIPKGLFQYERSRGRLTCVNDPPELEGYPNWRLIRMLMNYVEDTKCGTVFAIDTQFLYDRCLSVSSGPDLVFFGLSRIDDLRRPERVGTFVPDLVAERCSRDSDRRVNVYMKAGVQIVWIVDEQTRTITTVRSNCLTKTLTMTDTLSGDEVVPGFDCPVAYLLSEG